MKLVKENLMEGVADKVYPNFNIPGDFDNFEKIYAEQEIKKEETKMSNIEFEKKDNWSLIKNPVSLQNFGPSIRGVIMENGDFYLENVSGVIHNDILDILYKKGVIKEPVKRNWGRKFPFETEFLTVQRYGDSNNITIGESNKAIYVESEYNKNRHYYTEFMNKAKKKCPNINFIDKLIGIKYLKEAKGFHIL
jgi:hypothetical protein